MKKAFRMSIMILGFIALGLSAQAAQAETITFGTSERMYAPNCHCKADVSTYDLAPWCDAKTSCDGDTDTHTINLAAGNYEVKVNLAGLTDYQKYEVVVLNINGKEYTIPDQGGNSSSTGTATYNLGKMYLSGTVTVRAYHKYANTFTGKWYADEYSKIGSYAALESVYVTAVTFNKIAEPKPTCSISANPTTINSGGTSTLSWSSQNATSASINQNIGSVSTSGTKSVKPASSTTYTMTVTGAGGSATCSAIVNVNIPKPKPTCSISANPTTINSGGTSTLSWSSQNATSASINQNIGSVSTSGTKSVKPASSTTYTMTVTGAGGSATCSAGVTVNVLTPAIKIEKNDNDNRDDTQTIKKGEDATFKITVTNIGNAPLKDVVVSDELAPGCARSATQTKGLYEGELFDPRESFSYICKDNNITESYTNKASVRATNPVDNKNLSDDDTSKVVVSETPAPEPEPIPEPKPEPTPEPKPEPKKKECRGTIGNYVWLDANSDGIQDKGEKGLSGITVKLKTDDGKLIDKDKTNSKGEYEFDDLCAGDYTVYVDDEDVAGYTQTYDPDGKKNNKTDVTLEGDKDSHTKADFGYNKGRTTPVTGSGGLAITFTGLISAIGYASYRQLKQKVTGNTLA